MDIDTDPKRAILFGISEIPEFGGVLSFLVATFWPQKGDQDPWELIKERTEALINQKLNDFAYKQVQTSLTGIKDTYDDFHETMNATTDKGQRFSIYESFKLVFLDHEAQFQQSDYQTLLLPLFSQFANLYLSFLRTGYQHGKEELGLGQDSIDLLRTNLKKKVKAYSDYAMATLDSAKGDKFANLDPRDEFVRSMTLNVVDYVTLWKYMDPDQPAPSGMPLTRELFSSLAGVSGPYFHQPSDPGYYPPPPSADKISRIMVWGASAIDAIQVWYGDKATPKMGGNGGRQVLDVDLTDKGHGELTLLDAWENPGTLVQGLRLTCNDKSTPGVNVYGGRNVCLYPPAGHYISSISVISRYQDHERGWLYNDLVRTLYCGFKFKPDALNPPSTLQMSRVDNPA